MNIKNKILIVDDEKNMRDGLLAILENDYQIELAEDGEVALQKIKTETFDIVLSDLNMPKIDGFGLIREVAKMKNPPLVIILTAYGSIETAINAMKIGAYNYLTKPLNIGQLEMMIEQGLKEINESRQKEKSVQNVNLSTMIGSSAILEKVKSEIKLMANAKSTVLIYGESGTGKELVAESLHNLSNRSKKPFVVLHCASLNSNLFESELFGYEKGAFTGANERRIGRIEMANCGSLFLDEIGEIDLTTQVKLLRILETKKFERVGGNSQIEVDTRIICATNRDLKEEVKKGNFREDLYYRLSVLQINLPPLRERDSDIVELISFFLKRSAKENNKEVLGIQSEALQLLKAYKWVGNIRELRNVLERMVVMTKGKTLTVADIPNEILENLLKKSGEKSELNIEENENKLIENSLEKNDWNVTKTSEELGISRRTLQRKMQKNNIIRR